MKSAVALGTLASLVLASNTVAARNLSLWKMRPTEGIVNGSMLERRTAEGAEAVRNFTSEFDSVREASLRASRNLVEGSKVSAYAAPAADAHSFNIKQVMTRLDGGVEMSVLQVAPTKETALRTSIASWTDDVTGKPYTAIERTLANPGGSQLETLKEAYTVEKQGNRFVSVQKYRVSGDVSMYRVGPRRLSITTNRAGGKVAEEIYLPNEVRGDIVRFEPSQSGGTVVVITHKDGEFTQYIVSANEDGKFPIEGSSRLLAKAEVSRLLLKADEKIIKGEAVIPAAGATAQSPAGMDLGEAAAAGAVR